MVLFQKKLAFTDPIFIVHYSVFEKCLGLWDIEGYREDPSYLIFWNSFQISFLHDTYKILCLVAAKETISTVKLSPFGNSFKSKGAINSAVYENSDEFQCDHHHATIKLASEYIFKKFKNVYVITENPSDIEKHFDPKNCGFTLINSTDALKMIEGLKNSLEKNLKTKK